MSLSDHGYEFVKGALSREEVFKLRNEATRLSKDVGNSCVRDVLGRSPVIRNLAHSHQIRHLLPDDLSPVRSILFDKTVDENWPVAWHQDLSIAVQSRNETPGYQAWSTKDGVMHVQPPVHLLEEMITVRINLDTTPLENGPLQVISGSHRYGKIPASELPIHVKGEPVICKCEAGDILLMKPLILHASKRATKPGHRRVIHIEYARKSDLNAGLSWHCDTRKK